MSDTAFAVLSFVALTCLILGALLGAYVGSVLGRRYKEDNDE